MKQKMGQAPAKQSLTKYTDVLKFGKYKGKTVEFVLNVDASYLVWAMENEICTATGDISEDAMEIAYEEELDRYGGWLGIDPYDFCD